MDFCIDFGFRMINWGLLAGFILGAIWLLRPVTNRLLTPRQRFWLWVVGWLSAFLPTWNSIFGWIRVFPVTLRDFLTPRGGYNAIPYYLPESYEGAGVYNLAIPGDGAVQVELNDTFGVALFLVWAAGFLVIILKLWWGSRKLARLRGRGERLERPELDWGEDPVAIYLCGGLPTSFVHQSFWSGRPTIFLQKELPEHRRELILKHEYNHIRLRHCQMKGWMMAAMVFHWWNPLIWLAYAATCRDLELDCDDRSMQQLSPDERREYAYTLLELGAGKQLWDAPLCFGECDAAVRIKAVAAWKPMQGWRKLGTWLLTLFLLLCFTGGPGYDEVELPADAALEYQQIMDNWDRLTDQDKEELVEGVKSYLQRSYGLLTHDDITQIWLPEEGVGNGFCLISTGEWRRVNFWPNKDGITFKGGMVVDPPDLTGFRLVYKKV